MDMPLRLGQKLANLDEAAEWLGLPLDIEADVSAKLTRGHEEYAETLGEARTVSDVKLELYGEALDLLAYPSLVGWDVAREDPDLLDCLQCGARLARRLKKALQVSEATPGHPTPPAPVETQQGASMGPAEVSCNLCFLVASEEMGLCLKLDVPRIFPEHGGGANGINCPWFLPCTESKSDPDLQRQWASVHAPEVRDEH